MRVTRLLKHAFIPSWVARRAFPARTIRKIERALKEASSRSGAELRFVAEAGLPLHYLFGRRSSRRRAEELFSLLRVWDTEHNNGVLVYVQLLSRHIDIVADRGIATRVGQAEWDAVCREMERAFARAAYEDGALAAIERIAAVVARHFPA